ncbi:ribosomal protein S18 acetylase RimI-like enzyme [Frigoribacterium sp. PhB160]|uniref:GNAT family acetyltransferase n=1 Tax=Frigoribacterium sp. PhB160 TaxID=2485192 RepID=UPI000F494451|nr:GNAT family acetyltransferase [Frigoribacterium sp. PhB160]ROS61017.1 ribosomal protein S18 acetylase RimI-like enzyme [Frigoribacterium sp. PhB160]
MEIRPFEPADTEAVVALWEECGLTRPWNDPRADIARKLLVQPELFLVGVEPGDGREEALVATAMAGHEGHRGWLHYVAVSPSLRGAGRARSLVAEVERLLTEAGCPKLQLMVRTGNEPALAAWRRLGYEPADAVVLGKRLIAD